MIEKGKPPPNRKLHDTGNSPTGMETHFKEKKPPVKQEAFQYNKLIISAIIIHMVSTLYAS